MSDNPYAPPRSHVTDPEYSNVLALHHKFLFTCLIAFLFRLIFSNDFSNVELGWHLLSLLNYPVAAGLVSIALPTERIGYFIPGSLLLAFPASRLLSWLLP